MFGRCSIIPQWYILKVCFSTLLWLGLGYALLFEGSLHPYFLGDFFIGWGKKIWKPTKGFSPSFVDTNHIGIHLLICSRWQQCYGIILLIIYVTGMRRTCSAQVFLDYFYVGKQLFGAKFNGTRCDVFAPISLEGKVPMILGILIISYFNWCGYDEWPSYGKNPRFLMREDVDLFD